MWQIRAVSHNIFACYAIYKTCIVGVASTVWQRISLLYNISFKLKPCVKELQLMEEIYIGRKGHRTTW